MKRPGLPLLILSLVSPALAQMQSITTYGSGVGLGPVTTIQPTGNGYTYSTIGGPNGGSWGGVIASPGTILHAAVVPHGNVVPIVSAAPARVVAQTPDPALVSAQIAAANAQELAADAQLLESLPAVPRSVPVRVARAIPVDQNKQYPKPRPAPPNSSAAYQYAFLHNQLTPEGMRQLAKDWKADSQLKEQGRHDAHTLLAYVTIWVRFHPEFIQLIDAK